mgnify:CR=1 FL=1
MLGNSSSQAKSGRKINVNQAKPGDLLIFGRNGKVVHVAIVAENKRNKLEIIHSSSSRGVVRQDITKSEYWQKRLMYAVDVFDSRNATSE